MGSKQKLRLSATAADNRTPAKNPPAPLTLTRRELRDMRVRNAGEQAQPSPNRRARTSRSRSFIAGMLALSLLGTVALPAYSASPSSVTLPTIQQESADQTQRFIAASITAGGALDRESYAATTLGEIETKKAKEAAAAAAAAAARTARESPASANDRAVPVLAVGSGTVRWPLMSSFTITDRFGARGGAHMGTDMVTAGGTPIYASVSGTVNVSRDDYGAYGAAVTVDSVVDGQRIGAIYPHMQYNSRQVTSGEVVQAGQLLGYVGSTGRSTANHLHFEVSVNGTTVDSLAWLEANAR